jgi:DNA repair protein RadC
LCAAADILDMPLLDHLIVGDSHRYYSFREAGALCGPPHDGVHQ